MTATKTVSLMVAGLVDVAGYVPGSRLTIVNAVDAYRTSSAAAHP